MTQKVGARARAERDAFIAQHLAAQQEYESRATAATARAATALERLLVLAETRDSGQIQRVALFLGAV